MRSHTCKQTKHLTQVQPTRGYCVYLSVVASYFNYLTGSRLNR